ncbi:MAG: 4-hydroxy-tetrahydrodipicolinate synthase, partial [Burkholderiales bacterium PBB5]
TARAAADAVLADGRLALLAGNAAELFAQLARGAVGGFVASAHLATARFVALYRAMAANDLATARRLWRQLQPITAAAFAEPNPAPVKAALAQQGWLADDVRPPLLPAGQATTQALQAAVAQAEAG